MSPLSKPESNAIRLHLGCGMTTQEGWVNCDYIQTDFTDLVFDVQQSWPLADNSVHEIYASHMLEHLTDFNTFFKEAWRVLHPNGGLVLRTPHGHHRAAWWDVEHIRPWFPESFAYLQPGYAKSIRNPQHNGRKEFFGIQTVDQRVAGKFAPVLKWSWGRRLLMPWLCNMTDALEELYAYLYALKDPASIAQYAAANQSFAVPSRYTMYQHHLDGKEVPPNSDTGVSIVVLADIGCMATYPDKACA